MLNENGNTRRERLHGNVIAEDVFVRCHVFLTSRLHTSHQLAGEADNICVTELSSKLNTLLQSSSSSSSSSSLSSDSSGLCITDISDSIVDQVLPMYSSNLLLAEDASMAAAFLYIAHAMFPSFFDPVQPFSPVETLLINGNIVLPYWESTSTTNTSSSSTTTITTITTITTTTNTTPNLSSSSLKSSNEVTMNNVVEKPIAYETTSSSPFTSTSIIPTEIHGLYGLVDHPFEDKRPCYLCGMRGDNAEAGRMLCTPSGEWVHLNCIYYSYNTVLEKTNYIITKYPAVKAQSNSNICYICNKPGAFIQCKSPSCSHCFHFTCGRRNGCMIMINRMFTYCSHHNPKHRSRTTTSFSGPTSIASTRIRTTNPTIQGKTMFRNASSMSSATNITSISGNITNSNRSPALTTPTILSPTSSGLGNGQPHSGEVNYAELAMNTELLTTQFNHCIFIEPPHTYELIVLILSPDS